MGTAGYRFERIAGYEGGLATELHYVVLCHTDAVGWTAGMKVHNHLNMTALGILNLEGYHSCRMTIGVPSMVDTSEGLRYLKGHCVEGRIAHSAEHTEFDTSAIENHSARVDPFHIGPR
jgi:hypothetical protein